MCGAMPVGVVSKTIAGPEASDARFVWLSLFAPVMRRWRLYFARRALFNCGRKRAAVTGGRSYSVITVRG